ncbi:MAG: TrmH family RNA methyltransferase [Psychroflexus sp.]|nr:TrmH family RNA methyltransferase [Psychroflexus sp.]MDN6309554.1 TrmH family RNA methyltransferase [Psychroflexus sp.]
MSHQLVHSEYKTQATKAKIYLLIDTLSSPANLGAIYRLADAFAVKEIFLNESLEEMMLSTRFKRTSRSSEKYVNTSLFNNLDDTLSELKKQTKKVIGIELTSESQAIHNFNFQATESYVLIFGHEQMGLSPEILSQLDTCLHINLFGQNSSINVAQSCGIALYEITRQLNV